MAPEPEPEKAAMDLAAVDEPELVEWVQAEA